MAITVAELVATLGIEDKGFRGGLDRIGGLLASGAIIAGLNKVEQAASNLQQAAGGTSAVFGEMAGIIDSAAKDSAESMGLSERAFREATSRIGALLKGMGYDTRAAAEESIRLTQVGADLAATFGGTTAEAVDALAAALRGEMDPIERYGISLRQADVEAKALSMGLWDGVGTIDAYAKAQASLAIITEKSGGALGQFAREADTAAGQAQISAAKTENAQANLGEALLPIYARISSALGTVADAFAALPEPAQTAILAMLGIAMVAGPISTTVGLIKSLQAALIAAEAAGSLKAALLLRLTPQFLMAGGAIAGAATAMALWSRAVGEANREAAEGATQARASFIASVDSAEEYHEALSMLASTQRELAEDSSNAWNPVTQENMGRAADALAGVHNEMAALIPVINAIADETGDADSAITTVLGSIDAVTAALASGMSPAAAAQVAIDEELARASLETADALGEQTEETVSAGQALSDYLSTLRGSIDPLFGLINALESNRQAQADLAEAQADGTTTQEELNAAQMAVAESALGVEEAAVRLTQAMADGSVSTEDAARMLQAWVANGLITQDTANVLAERIGLAALAADQFDGNYTATLNADTGPAARAIANLINTYDNAVIDLQVSARVPGGGQLRAAGGRVNAGEGYTVGELGREYFVPDTAGTIVNAQQLRDLEGGGATDGGGVHIGTVVLQTPDPPRQWLEELQWTDWRTR